MGTLGIALGTVLLPEMSSLIAGGKVKGAHAAQNRAAALGLLLTLPFVAAYFAIPLTIMRALFAHGAFHLQAATISAHALMAYGVGLPAFVLVRIVAPTFYARGDTAAPVRATLVSVAVNIALKFVLVWGLSFGAVGIALGTALAAWVNVGVLLWMARARDLIEIEPAFWRALGPIVLAAAITGAGAFGGATLGAMVVSGHWQDEAMLAIAVLCGGAGYLATALIFRRSLPLGRFAS